MHCVLKWMLLSWLSIRFSCNRMAHPHQQMRCLMAQDSFSVVRVDAREPDQDQSVVKISQRVRYKHRKDHLTAHSRRQMASYQ